MTIPVTLNTISNLQDTTTAQTNINANSAAISGGFSTALDVTGDQMKGNLDMNSNQIINLPTPATAHSPVRLIDFSNLITGSTTPVTSSTAVLTVGGGGATSLYATVQIAGADSNPSLTPNSGVLMALNGTVSASALAFGMATTSPNSPWIQARNWFSAQAENLQLNPLGGFVQIGTSLSSITNVNTGLIVGNNWGGSTTYSPPASANSIFPVNVYGESLGVYSTARTANISGTSGSALSIASYAFADKAADIGAWPLYLEGHRLSASGYAYGVEISVVDRANSYSRVNPYFGSLPGSIGLQIDCGNSVSAADYLYYPAGAAMTVVANSGSGQTAAFGQGIVFLTGSIDTTIGGTPGRAISFADDMAISWYTADAVIGSALYAKSGTMYVTSGLVTGAYTVTSLPAGVTGTRAYVTDATATVFMSTVTGGGTAKVPVFYNGSSWLVG